MLAIVNYGVGNLTSILNMHRRIGIQACITSDIDEIKKADKIILPGVGHFDKCMQNFSSSGMRDVLEDIVAEGRTPVLGICVGAQMMTRGSEEGTEKGLAWVNADTVRFRIPAGASLKVPHMGWTDVRFTRMRQPWQDMPDEPRFYFAHSYHFQFDSDDYVEAVASYEYEFPVAFRKENVFGVQFHPEKSHKYGMKLIANFGAM